MPYSLVYPPRGREEDVPKWRHPMERMTSLYYEAEMAMTMFHMPYHEWLKVPKAARLFQMAVYRLHQEKEGYYSTPKEERFSYFNKR